MMPAVTLLVCITQWLALMLQVGVRSMYLARRMKRIRGATLGHKSSVKTTLQVACNSKVNQLAYWHSNAPFYLYVAVTESVHIKSHMYVCVAT